MKGIENTIVGDMIVPSVQFTMKSTPIVAKTKKLKGNWTATFGKMVNGTSCEKYYYETVQMSEDVTRYYARCSLDKWEKEETEEVMKWLRKKLSKPKYTILREGSNFFDVMWTEKFKEVNGV